MSRTDFVGSTYAPDAQLSEAMSDLLKTLPGGQHIAPHVNDGPFYLIPVLSRPDPNWQARVVMASYPKVTLPYFTEWHQVLMVDVYAVPEFAKQMLYWHQTDDELDLAADDSGPFEHPPTDADIVQLVPQWLAAEDTDTKDHGDQFVAALEQVVDAAGPAAAVAFLSQVTTDLAADLAALATTMLGVLTTDGVPAPSSV